MTIADEQDLKGLRAAGKVAAQCMGWMCEQAREGMTTAQLDALGQAFLDERGAKSAPQLTYNFPGATCISVNEEVAHGIPGARVLKRGDLVNVDVSLSLDGYFADTGMSFVLGEADPAQAKIIDATRLARDAAIARIHHGQPFSLVGRMFEKIARASGLRVIRNLGSHGVGRSLHEPPEFIPPYLDRSEKRLFRRGMVLTIEPFLTNGDTWVQEASDGWTLRNRAGSRSAQFEHTIVVTDGAPLIMTMP